MKFVVQAAVASVAVLLAIRGAGSVQADGIALYEANDTANDSIGSHNGTLVGGAGYGSGVSGSAFDLNGSTGYVSVPDSADWAFGSGDFTLSLSVNFDSIRTGSLGALPNVFLGQDTGGGPLDKWVFFYDGAGNLAFHINGSSGSAFLTPTTTVAPGVGDWHDYAVTRSGSTYTFYFDGTSLGTASSSVFINDASAALTIGQAEGLGYLDGRLDNVRIFGRALSGDEIAGLGNPVPEPTTLALVALGAAVLGRRTRRKRSAT